MNRWAWTAAATAGWVGLTAVGADTPLPTAGEVITLRTAGQPERKVQVLKAERAADGTVLTDVKDLTSGMVYTLTDARGTARPAEPAARPAVLPPAPPPTGRPAGTAAHALTHWDMGKPPAPLFGPSAKPVSPTTPKTTAVIGPAAKPREVDPLLAAAAARRPEVVVPAKTPTLFGKLFGTDKPAVPAPRVGGTPAVFGPPVGLKTDAHVIRPSAFSAPTAAPPVAAQLPKPAPVAAPTRVVLVPDATNPVLATDPPRVSAVLPTPAVPAALAAPPAPAAAPTLTEPVLTVAPPVLTAAPPTLPSPTEPTLTAPPVVAQPVLAEPPAPTPVATAPTLDPVPPAPAPVVVDPTPPVAQPAAPAPAARVALEEMKPAPQLVPLPPLDVASPAAPPKPAPNAFEPVPVVLPSATEPAPAAPTVIAPVVTPTAPAVTATAPPAAAAVQPVSHPDERMRAELSGTVQALRSSPRPRQRLEAASALANGPYANRVEVQAVILEAARSDASPVIRGHCIRLLTQLGVTDPSYQEDLLKWANDPEPAVSRAAGDALQKLAGK